MNQRTPVITVQAPAKINLSLQIMGKRSDGYHELDSLFMPVSLSDELNLECLPEGSPCELNVVAEGIDISALGAPSDNLILRAAALLRSETACRLGARIHVIKRIPLGGGLGGGSSDCAATLKGLNALWGLGLGPAKLEELAARLGSDIPAFVRGGAVRMRGRGEIVQPAFTPKELEQLRQQPPRWFALVNCGVHCPTKEVYQNLTPSLTNGADFYYTVASSFLSATPVDLAGVLQNSLQDGVFRRYPMVSFCAETVRKAGAEGVLLSGSGATVFGVVRDEAHGQTVCERLPSEWWKICVCSCPMV